MWRENRERGEKEPLPALGGRERGKEGEREGGGRQWGGAQVGEERVFPVSREVIHRLHTLQLSSSALSRHLQRGRPTQGALWGL